MRSVSILRDTGAEQSFILEGALPFSNETYTGTDVLVRGIELNCIHLCEYITFLYGKTLAFYSKIFEMDFKCGSRSVILMWPTYLFLTSGPNTTFDIWPMSCVPS